MSLSDFVIRDLSTNQMSNVTDFITSLSTSWSLDAVSQLSVTIHDMDMQMFLNNYFMVRREVTYRNDLFEIASVEIAQSEAKGAEVTLECRKAAIQRMKRDKNPEAYGGVTATDYAHIVADRFGLKFVGEPTSTARSVVKSNSSNTDESVWTVLGSLASKAQFNVFESDGTLYFASQEWLLGKWENLAFNFPSSLTGTGSEFQILEIPNCRRSDDDPNEAEVGFILNRSETTMAVRPGMTLTLSGMGEFNRQYIVSEVAYSLGVPDPVGISARTPVKKKPNQ